MLRSLLKCIWGLIPSRIRPYFAIEPLRLILPKAHNPAEAEPYYIVGFFSASTGLAQGARLFFQEKKQQGATVYAVDATHLLRSKVIPCLFTPEAGEVLTPASFPQHAMNAGSVVIHANPAAFMLALWHVRKLLPGKRIVAYWAWELEEIPHFWTRCLDYLDEVLVPSLFVAEAIRKHTHKPVRAHPHAALPVYRRQKLKKRPFTVLGCCAFGSNFYRKNPLAVVETFKAVFKDSPDAQLVLKVTEMNRCPDGWHQLLDAADNVNIRFCLGHLSDQGMAALYAEADVYLSLHRSEGFGLTIQEAMQHGLPVIATGWSGNVEFMRGEQCKAVPYSLVPVNDPQGSYTVPGARWAEPDISAAAAMLREVRDALR